MGNRLKSQCVKCFGTRWSERPKKLKPRYVGKNLEAHTRMWTVSKKSRPSWAKHWDFSRRSSPTGRKQLLMGGPLYSEGTGLLLAGAAVFVVGFFVFCCIDHCWLRRDLRKADRWSIFPSSSNSNSASDSMYSPWNSLTLTESWKVLTDFFSRPESVAVFGQSFQKNPVSPKLSKFWRSPLNIEFCQENIHSLSIWKVLFEDIKMKFIRIKCTFKFTSVVPSILLRY